MGLGLAGSPGASSSTPPIWQDLKPGPHGVGFTASCALDRSRAVEGVEAEAGFQARPIRILTWYPAATSDDAAATFGDYFRAGCPEPLYEDYLAMLQARDRDTGRRQFSPASDEGLAAVQNLATAAVVGAPPADRRFPLILHSLGRNDYQQESTVLWEYLASHGFVISVVPQMGASLTEHRLALSVEDLDRQADDLAFVLGEMSTRPFVDPDKVAVLGHSLGGIAGLLLAARNTNIDGLVSLEGAETTPDGSAVLKAAGWTPERITVPVLQLYALGGRNTTLELVRTLEASRLFVVGFGGGAPPRLVTHFDFQNWPLYSVVTGTEDPRGASLRPSTFGAAAYLAAARLTRHFLAATLKGDERSWRTVTGDRPLSGAPEGLLSFGLPPE